MSEATFNASSIQRWCQHQFKGRATQIQTCLGDQSRMLLARGGKLPSRFVGTLLARATLGGGVSSAVSTIAAPMPGRIGAPSGVSSAVLGVSGAQLSGPNGLGSSLSESSETSVPAVERVQQPMAIASLVRGGIALLGAAQGPPQNGMPALPPSSTAGALINVGQSLIQSWLMPGRAMMGAAIAPMAGMAGRMAGGMLVDAGVSMAGRALTSMFSDRPGGGLRMPSSRRVRALVRLVGVEAASMTLDLPIGQTAWLATRPGRRRGISARDVRTTRRVVRFACNLSSSLASVRAAPRRKRC